MKTITSRIRFPMRFPQSLGLVLLSLVLSVAQKARGMPTFPAEIQSHLGLSYTPPCTFCHATASGGGAIVTVFGQSMLKAGLTPDISTLDPALDTLKANQTDSDGNGVPDIQQIEEGLDPSTGHVSGPAERYGCGAHIATGKVRSRAVVIGAWVVLGLVVIARRQPRFRGKNASDKPPLEL